MCPPATWFVPCYNALVRAATWGGPYRDKAKTKRAAERPPFCGIYSLLSTICKFLFLIKVYFSYPEFPWIRWINIRLPHALELQLLCVF